MEKSMAKGDTGSGIQENHVGFLSGECQNYLFKSGAQVQFFSGARHAMTFMFLSCGLLLLVLSSMSNFLTTTSTNNVIIYGCCHTLPSGENYCKKTIKPGLGHTLVQIVLLLALRHPLTNV